MKYSKLTQTYEALSKTSKRLKKIAILAEFLKTLKDEDKEVLYLLLGRAYPAYDERRIGVSEKLAIKAISKATGIGTEKVMQEWKTTGDLGGVAEKLISKRKQKSLDSKELTTQKVLENLRKLPEMEGKGSISKKLNIIIELLSSAKPLEAKYIVRTIIGDLRIGIQESTIRDALAEAFFEKSASSKIQEALDRSNDLAKVFEACKTKNLKSLAQFEIEVGKPIKVMLAQKVSTIEEGFKALGKPCAIEYKYDGFRLVIHKKGKEVILFTRRLENVTKQFPEVVENVLKYVKGDSFILDSEAIGYDKKTKKYTPFQAISQRIKRKYGIEKLCKELPVEVHVFDILHYNGKSVVNEPFKKRTAMLKRIIIKKPYKIVPAKQIITSDEKKAKEFYKMALKDNQEGVMMKNLNAKYKPGKRVGYMLKIKPEERDLDLVITGAEYGKGKRKGWFSSFILSCKKGNEYLEVGKVGTGIKEKKEEGLSFEELTERIKPLIIKEEANKVKVKPKIVVAVTYQEIQKSPNYKSGLALRFPRITALRDDKPVSEISTLEEIKREFEKQKN